MLCVRAKRLVVDENRQVYQKYLSSGEPALGDGFERAWCAPAAASVARTALVSLQGLGFAFAFRWNLGKAVDGHDAALVPLFEKKRTGYGLAALRVASFVTGGRTAISAEFGDGNAGKRLGNALSLRCSVEKSQCTMPGAD